MIHGAIECIYGLNKYCLDSACESVIRNPWWYSVFLLKILSIIQHPTFGILIRFVYYFVIFGHFFRFLFLFFKHFFIYLSVGDKISPGHLFFHEHDSKVFTRFRVTRLTVLFSCTVRGPEERTLGRDEQPSEGSIFSARHLNHQYLRESGVEY